MANVPQEEIKASDLLRMWRSEMDEYYSRMKEFREVSPPVALSELAGMTARFSEIRAQIVRLPSPKLEKFRTQEIDYFLTECDRQFKIWSRLISVAQLEHEVTRGF